MAGGDDVVRVVDFFLGPSVHSCDGYRDDVVGGRLCVVGGEVFSAPSAAPPVAVENVPACVFPRTGVVFSGHSSLAFVCFLPPGSSFFRRVSDFFRRFWLSSRVT
jgi:hypothetical protein